MKKCNIMKHVKPIIMLLILFFGFVGKLQAYMFGNESCLAFPRSCNGGEGLVSGTSIGSFIIEGGYNFFKSDSNMSRFISMVEISELNGTDFKALQAALNSTVDNLEKAKASYYQLKELASSTPYNQDVILQLMTFDYFKYQSENVLIPMIFEKVKKYLSVG
ncbi:MAG: hypothetical protein MUF15_27040, partial [Acidobacteria bacterium]|nr:hypothetical protein [Acidobacteriota bacterium]